MDRKARGIHLLQNGQLSSVYRTSSRLGLALKMKWRECCYASGESNDRSG